MECGGQIGLTNLNMVDDLRDPSEVQDGFLSNLFAEEAGQAASKDKHSFSVALTTHLANAGIGDLPQAILGGVGDGTEMQVSLTFRV
jgi:hypothetical protein